MAIYRGVGDTSTGEVTDFQLLADEAAASAAAALVSENNAETAEVNAELAEANAETAATNASTSATNAENSAFAASTSASNAASSAASAANSASTATTQATNAANSATSAAASASQALDILDDSLLKANNLSDLTNTATARTNLGLGTAAITNSTDYATAAQGTKADTAYGWGNHALVGYLTSEADPIFVASPAHGITGTNITTWNTAYSWGNHASAGYAHAGANTDITSMSGVTGGITTPDYVTFDTTPETTPTAEGSLYWDSADGNQTLSLIMAGGNVTQQIGEEQYYRIKASSAITNGQVVMFTGSVGASGALTGAPATGLTASTASYVMGIATQDIPLNGWGYVTSFGLVRNLNTSAFTSGSILYLDPTVAGGLTATVPSAPNPKVQVCACVHQSSTVGALFVRPSFGGILGQYEGDVNISSAATGDVLTYNGSTWNNSKTLSGAYTFSGGTANGVAYLNGSKVLTTGSALTFNGTSLGVGTDAPLSIVDIVSSGVAYPRVRSTAATAAAHYYQNSASGTSNTDGLFVGFDGSLNGYLYNYENAPLIFGTNAAEQMRLTSTGLGIGTSVTAGDSGYTALTLGKSSGQSQINFRDGTNQIAQFVVNSSGVTLNYQTLGFLRIYNNGEVARFDPSGNFGLGVTPSAWGSNNKALQIANRTALSELSGYTYLGNNFYIDGTGSKYISTAAATQYVQGTGAHYWNIAPSGTAGNAISFTKAMTLDASGNLMVNATSAILSAANRGNITIGGSASSVLVLGTGSTTGTYAYHEQSTGNFDLWNGANGFVRFATNNTERMRITSGGEVYIAGTTDQGAYNLQCNGTGVWGAGAYVNGSDAALKENVTTLDNSLGLINAMRPVTFTYKEDYSKDRSVQTGFIAQELQEVLAGKDYLGGIVQAGPEHLNVAYQNLIPLLVKAIQELTARVAQLEGI